jgi:hypothetical protein
MKSWSIVPFGEMTTQTMSDSKLTFQEKLQLGDEYTVAAHMAHLDPAGPSTMDYECKSVLAIIGQDNL